MISGFAAYYVCVIIINPDSLSTTDKLCKKCKRSCTDNGCPIINFSKTCLKFAYFSLYNVLIEFFHVIAMLLLLYLFRVEIV